MTNDENLNSLNNLFHKSIRVEQIAIKFYLHLAAMFSNNEKLHLFFNDLANDETLHASALREAMSLLSPEQLNGLVDEHKIKEIDAILQKMNMINYDSLKNLDEVYELAHDVEFSEINSIFLYLTIECVPSQNRKELFRTIIDEHQNKLTDFSILFGDREWRKSIVPNHIH